MQDALLSKPQEWLVYSKVDSVLIFLDELHADWFKPETVDISDKTKYIYWSLQDIIKDLDLNSTTYTLLYAYMQAPSLDVQDMVRQELQCVYDDTAWNDADIIHIYADYILSLVDDIHKKFNPTTTMESDEENENNNIVAQNIIDILCHDKHSDHIFLDGEEITLTISEESNIFLSLCMDHNIFPLLRSSIENHQGTRSLKFDREMCLAYLEKIFEEQWLDVHFWQEQEDMVYRIMLQYIYEVSDDVESKKKAESAKYL